jgi:hypothetical protein
MADNTAQELGTEESSVEAPKTEPVKEINVDEIVASKIQESLKPIKENLDKAYQARDEALKKIAEYEKEKKEAELERLREAGKFKEVYELQLAEERARREAVENENIQLTRDINVRSALAAQDFRNEAARDMAYREIVGQLVRTEDGQWVHRSGLNINDYVKAYVEKEEYNFLLKPKVSSGSGGSGPSTSSSVSSGTKKKSLFEMSQDEVIKLAQEGKLPPV